MYLVDYEGNKSSWNLISASRGIILNVVRDPTLGTGRANWHLECAPPDTSTVWVDETATLHAGGFAYWHSDFGRPKSHGCINTPTTIAEKLFYWTDPQLPDGKNLVHSTPDNPGTRVVVHP